MDFTKKKVDGIDYDSSAPLGTSHNPSHKILTISNLITLSRMILTFVFLYLFVQGEHRYLALVVYAVAASTDWLDGKVARATNTVSWFGKMLDPIVDRLLLATGVIGLTARGELPVWIAVVLIARDVYLGIGMAAIRRFYSRRPLDVIYIGKVTTALLMTGFSWMLLGLPVLAGLGLIPVSWLPLLNSQAACAGILVIYPGVVCSIITAVIYTKEAIAVRRAALEAGHRL